MPQTADELLSSLPLAMKRRALIQALEEDPSRKDLKKKLKPCNDACEKASAALEEMEALRRMEGGLHFSPAGEIDYSHDFFGRPSFLTVSGQLQVCTPSRSGTKQGKCDVEWRVPAVNRVRSMPVA